LLFGLLNNYQLADSDFMVLESMKSNSSKCQ
jgi:hypothetical protein